MKETDPERDGDLPMTTQLELCITWMFFLLELSRITSNILKNLLFKDLLIGKAVRERERESGSHMSGRGPRLGLSFVVFPSKLTGHRIRSRAALGPEW